MAHIWFSWVMWCRTTDRTSSFLNFFEPLGYERLYVKWCEANGFPGVKGGKVLGDRPS